MSRLSGKDMGFMLGDLRLVAEEVTLTIEDGRTAALDNGVPNGFVDGESKAGGEITVDSKNFELIIESARTAGSFKQLEPFDAIFNAENLSEKINVEAFGCLIKVNDLINASASGGEKLKHKLSYEVTHKNFVRMNGVPYLSAAETDHLI